MSKMTLASYYHSLETPKFPRKEFVKEAAAQCGVEEATIRNWIRGSSKPAEARHYDVLSEITGIPKEQLFVNESNS